ncbi:hypothetical protein PybrP1_006228 [[Pythium] brassicae (nom. inval.)]|nr:hypothetical protein PybrP1_006228 [[Pythium] brassicae (nom. inval.)]
MRALSQKRPQSQSQPQQAKAAAGDEFLVQHLVDPGDWVSDNERSLCNVCTRQFGTFRRKHHCRMCGEIVCSGCTLIKTALLPTVGFTRVRVCVTCVFNHAPAPPKAQQPLHQKASSSHAADVSISSPTEEAREWLSSHLHSPISKSDEGDYDTEDSFEGNENSNNNNSNNNNNNREQPQAVKSPTRLYDSPSQHRSKQPRRDATASSPSALETRAASPSSHWSHPWPKPPVAADEASRLEALYALDVLDSSPEKPFDMICDLAKARLACPMAAVSFMDEHRQWFKASAGLAHKMIPRKIAFCAYTVFTKEPVVVLDTLKDKRFERNPLVSGAAAVRFYAAAPVLDRATGHAVGSVFVLDTRPREACDVAILERLAHAASENLPQAPFAVDGLCGRHQPPPLSPAPSTASLSSLPSSAAASPTSNAVPGKPAPLSTILTTTTTTNGASMAVATSSSTGSGVATGEQMEVLLMRLLTQNTETQQQLATQQMSISNTLGFHSTQISKLMTDFARMEAKIEATIK